MAKKIAVILSGCGVYDGSEIQEAVFTLLSLDQAGAQYQCFAPDKPQSEVIDHTSGNATQEERNVLKEAARIARGKIKPLSELNAGDFDAIFLPGGFGAAKNLCTYAKDGAQSQVDTDLADKLKAFHSAGKPVGAVCIAPVILATVFAELPQKPTLTIGMDKETASDLISMGVNHTECPVNELVIDDKNKIVTSPAYMYDSSPAPVFEGINKAVNALLKMA